MSITTSSDGLHLENKTTKETSIKPKTIELQEHTSESKEVISITTVEEEFLGIEQNEQKHDLYYNIDNVMIPSIQKDGKTNTKSEANYASLLAPAKLTEENTLCAIPKQKGRNSRGKVYKCITLTYQISCVVTLLTLLALVAAVYVEIANMKQSRFEVDKNFSSTLTSLEQSQHTCQADNVNIRNILESINRTFFSSRQITNVLRTDDERSSCADILHHNPSSPSGYYQMISNCTGTKLVYCDMSLTCGGITGGWMRIAQLDRTNNTAPLASQIHPSMEQKLVFHKTSPVGALQLVSTLLEFLTPKFVGESEATA